MNAIIRDQIGFKGLLMTDDISMGALSGSVGDRTKAAIAAGCDVVLHCNGNQDEMVSVVALAGTLAEDRAEAALSPRKTPTSVDIAALNEELNTLLG